MPSKSTANIVKRMINSMLSAIFSITLSKMLGAEAPSRSVMGERRD